MTSPPLSRERLLSRLGTSSKSQNRFVNGLTLEVELWILEFGVCPAKCFLSTARFDVWQVDCNWLKGEIHGKSGNFPSNFVEDLHLPPVANGQKIFQAVRSFPAEVQGDLGFQKGEKDGSACGTAKTSG